MLDILKKIGLGRKPVARRLTLAAFGKHPGWDDHIPGIGIETEALAQVKQSLYVGGIGGQLDSGLWRKLEFDQRLEGFDHVFLWLRPGHVLLGQLWSSVDGKGRKEYPMVLCLDGEGMPLNLVLEKGLPELDRLRGDCLKAALADQVYNVCKLSQERLQFVVEDAEWKPANVTLPVAARRRFLQNERFGAHGVGLARILHQLDSRERGEPSPQKAARSSHLRMPLGAERPEEAFLLWAAFLRQVIGQTPLLFVFRRGEAWLDAVVGEPVDEDFFCFQASPQALPLVTDIPFELPVETNQRTMALMTRFQAEENPAAVGGIENPDAGGRGWLSKLPAIGGVWLWGSINLVTLVIVFLWFAIGHRAGPVPAQRPPNVSASLAHQKRYEDAIRDGQIALGQSNFAVALAQATVAINLKSNDSVAIRLKADADKQMAIAAQSRQMDQQFQAALQSGRAELAQTNFDEALVEVKKALVFKPDHAGALRLQADIDQARRLAQEAEARKKKFREAMEAGQVAFKESKFELAAAQAQAGLNLKAGDATAAKLMSDAKAELARVAAARENELSYGAAMQSGLAAMNEKDYSLAKSQAEKARELRRDDPAATKLLADSKNALDHAAVATMPASPATPQVQTPHAGGEPVHFTNGLGMEFIGIQDPAAAGLLVGKYEVTQQQFQFVMGHPPEALPNLNFQGGDFPVFNVPFKDAKEFCQRLGQRDGKNYSLLTRSEWLAVAGLPTQGLQAAWEKRVAEGVLAHEVTSKDQKLAGPSRVGSLGAGMNGLCDLFGNVREWIEGDGESAGFSYNTFGSQVARADRLFLKPTGPEQWIVPATGLRCCIRPNK